MKKIIILLIILSVSTRSYSQYKLAQGEKQINAGVGFSDWGIPVFVGMDFGVHQDISLGGEVSFRSYYERWEHHSYHHSVLGVFANGNYHFNTVLKIPTTWDLYAGLNIGFYAWSNPDNYYRDRVSGLGLGIQLGGRYYFNDNVGVNLEIGGGNSFNGGKLGISYKF